MLKAKHKLVTKIINLHIKITEKIQNPRILTQG